MYIDKASFLSRAIRIWAEICNHLEYEVNNKNLFSRDELKLLLISSAELKDRYQTEILFLLNNSNDDIVNISFANNQMLLHKIRSQMDYYEKIFLQEWINNYLEFSNDLELDRYIHEYMNSSTVFTRKTDTMYYSREFYEVRAPKCWSRIYHYAMVEIVKRSLFSYLELEALLTMGPQRPNDYAMANDLYINISSVFSLYNDDDFQFERNLLESKLMGDMNVIENYFMVEWIVHYLTHQNNIDMRFYIKCFLECSYSLS